MGKIIQISTDSQPSGEDWSAWQVTTALCDDGTLWELEFNQKTGTREWAQLPEIPSNEIEGATPTE